MSSMLLPEVGESLGAVVVSVRVEYEGLPELLVSSAEAVATTRLRADIVASRYLIARSLYQC
jgi:hypothetical protein